MRSAVTFISIGLSALACGWTFPAFAAETTAPNLTQHWSGYLCMILFGVAYSLVVLEESIRLKKSTPAMLFAGLIWIVVAIAYRKNGFAEELPEIVRHHLLEFAKLMLFLMSAITYINTLEDRNIFGALRARIVSSGASLRQSYWLIGLIAFFMSPLADNLTTALVMGAVAISIGGQHKDFVVVACINVVVAANAGGAFSPFGDITTLMVWQEGLVRFQEFFALFIPSFASWIIPAALMSVKVPSLTPPPPQETAHVKSGGYIITGLFLLTILMTVMLHHALDLPPFVGMMLGLALLKGYCDWTARPREKKVRAMPAAGNAEGSGSHDGLVNLKAGDWDTLLFFYGIILCVGGLGAMGYLHVLSEFMYKDLGATAANVLVGLISALVDNIPIMFAVLEMKPDISHGQWLLVTLTTGIGGSLLSIGSAAGVALMGQARGIYTFTAHLKWSWAIAIGYAAGISLHIILNKVT